MREEGEEGDGSEVSEDGRREVSEISNSDTAIFWGGATGRWTVGSRDPFRIA